MKRFLAFLMLLLVFSGCGVSRAKRADFEAKIQELSSSYTKPADLSDEKWPEESVLRAKKEFAGSTGTDPDFLVLLAEEKSSNVRTRVAKNPRTPLKVLEQFAKSDEKIIRNYLAANSALTPELFDQLSRDPEPDVRQAAAANPNNSEANLQFLAADTDVNVQSFLARNPRLPEAAMLIMTQKSSLQALEVLLKRTDLPPAVIEALKKHTDEKIRQQAETYAVAPTTQK